jgi:hypothetical protein
MILSKFAAIVAEGQFIPAMETLPHSSAAAALTAPTSPAAIMIDLQKALISIPAFVRAPADYVPCRLQAHICSVSFGRRFDADAGALERSLPVRFGKSTLL